MQRTLVHLYGPLSIHSFGLMIALGLLVFAYLFLRHPKRKAIISREQFIDTLLLAIVIGIIGCRILYVITEWQTFNSWYDSFKIWEGGGSLLGGIIGIITVMPLYMHYHAIPTLALLDIAAIYAPLLQAISRLGCFFAGCCYGQITDAPWSVVYTDVDTCAPLGIALHPAQLYSSLMLLLVFGIMYFMVQKACNKQGQILAMYLMLAGAERFIMDFFRGDRTFFTLTPFSLTLAIHQWIALALIAIGLLLFVGISYNSQAKCTTYESI